MNSKEKNKLGGMLIVAGVLIGVGVGLYYGRPDVGVLVGIGSGFLTAVVLHLVKK